MKGRNPDEILTKLPKMPKLKLSIPNLTAKGLSDKLQELIKALRAPPQGPARPMKFPYTFSAKIAQFPYAFYYKNNFIFRYLPWGFLASTPVFWFIGTIVNREENKVEWKKIRQNEKDHAKHKFDLD